MVRSYTESWLDLHAVKMPGGPGRGRWVRMYREEDVTVLLHWTERNLVEGDRLRARCSELYIETQRLRCVIDGSWQAVAEYVEGAQR